MKSNLNSQTIKLHSYQILTANCIDSKQNHPIITFTCLSLHLFEPSKIFHFKAQSRFSQDDHCYLDVPTQLALHFPGLCQRTPTVTKILEFGLVRTDRNFKKKIQKATSPINASSQYNNKSYASLKGKQTRTVHSR